MSGSSSPTQTTIRVAGISGSLRKGSYTRMAVNLALQGAATLGADVQLIDLTAYAIPFCDGRPDKSTYPADLHHLKGEIAATQGIILGTPEYHGSYSGVLKNALDLMGFDEFEGKMVGLVGVSGGAMGALNALNELRIIGRTLHAWVIPEQVSLPRAWELFHDDGTPKKAEIEERLLELGQQVARFAYLHAHEDAQEFLRLWETAPRNPGADPPAT